jgi:hypothetical protein
MKWTTQGPCLQQISSSDAVNHPTLSAILKRTYSFDRAGRLTPLPEDKQLPLRLDPEIEMPGGYTKLDSDLYPCKPRTDVVVIGEAFTGMRPRSVASVTVAADGQTLAQRSLAISGPRKAFARGARIVFDEPSVVEKIPLSYKMAYGGQCARAAKEMGNPYIDAIPESERDPDTDPILASPWTYPRNPSGLGYTFFAPGEEGLALPQIEDPEDLLTPERLIRKDAFDWLTAPLPAGVSYFSMGWYPRIGYMGIMPPTEAEKVDPQLMLEVRRKWADSIITTPFHKDTKALMRHFNCASLGLQVAAPNTDDGGMPAGASIRLVGMHPAHESVVIDLPKQMPLLMVDGRKGTMKPGAVRIHTIEITPALNQVSIVWAGIAKALRPYSLEELKTMPVAAEIIEE